METISAAQKKRLVDKVREVIDQEKKKKQQSPYVAVVLAGSGKLYEGRSYFSDTFSLTLHGEQVALSHAHSHEETQVLAIAIGKVEDGEKGDYENPCHMCKQVMYESQRRSGVKMLVILVNNFGQEKEVYLDDMVSYPWPK